MANSVTVPEDVSAALKALRGFVNEDAVQLVGQWCVRPLPSPEFGPVDTIEPGSVTFNEAVQISSRYGQYANATRSEVSNLFNAVTELCKLAGKILDAYTEAETDQVKGLNDLATAMDTELAAINAALGNSQTGPAA